MLRAEFCGMGKTRVRNMGSVRDWAESSVEAKNQIMGDRAQYTGDKDSRVWSCRVKIFDIKDGHSLLNISLLRYVCVCIKGGSLYVQFLNMGSSMIALTKVTLG